MKKLFTFAAAVLASVSMMADDATFTIADIFDGNNQSAEVTTPAAATVSTTASKSNAKDGKLGSDGNYFQIVLSEATFSTVSMNGYINTTSTDKNWGFQFSTDGGETWEEEVSQANDGDKTAHDIVVSVDIPANANGFRVIRRAGTSTIVNSITLTLGEAVPVVTYTITYKANNGSEEADIIDPAAKKVAACTFTAPEGTAFAGWNTAADGQGTDYAVGAAIESDLTLYAQWEAITACAALYTATEGDEPAEGAAAALTSESFGGSIIFVGAKDGNYAASFIYTAYGLQMCKGGADSVRVILANEMQVGTLVQIKVYQSTIDDKTRGFKLLNLAKAAKLDASWVPTAEDNERVFTYEVVANDGLAGANAFIIQRNNSAVLESVVVSNCGVATAIENTPVEVKAVKRIVNGQLFIESNGVLYNAQGAIVK